MSKLRYSINQPFSNWWATRIGQVVLNFSAVELETYRWLVQLSENPERIPEWSNKPFKVRVQDIISYMDNRSYTPEWKSKSTAAWHEAECLARKRNRIAHNPLLFGWVDGKEDGEPDFIGVVDIRYPDKAEPFLKKDEISAIVNRIAELAPMLGSLREEWCAVRDSQ
jgi:hypothetical protein